MIATGHYADAAIYAYADDIDALRLLSITMRANRDAGIFFTMPKMLMPLDTMMTALSPHAR